MTYFAYCFRLLQAEVGPEETENKVLKATHGYHQYAVFTITKCNLKVLLLRFRRKGIK